MQNNRVSAKHNNRVLTHNKEERKMATPGEKLAKTLETLKKTSGQRIRGY